MKYRLHNDRFTAVADSMGAELISFQDETGKEYIWGGDPVYWPGRNPNLFPIVGSLKNGVTQIDGRSYSMNRHGFARNSEFAVISQCDQSIEFQLAQSNSTLQMFPYHFELRVRHSLTANGFTTQFTVTAPEDSHLPFCIGGHTAFRCEKYFSDYRIVFDSPVCSEAYIPTAAGILSEQSKESVLHNEQIFSLDHDLFARVDTLVFDEPTSHGVSLLDSDGHGVHMDYSDFPMVAFWTNGAKKAPYVCLEPWHGCACFEEEDGTFDHKRHCILLEPGESRSLKYTVRIL